MSNVVFVVSQCIKHTEILEIIEERKCKSGKKISNQQRRQTFVSTENDYSCSFSFIEKIYEDEDELVRNETDTESNRLNAPKKNTNKLTLNKSTQTFQMN